MAHPFDSYQHRYEGGLSYRISEVIQSAAYNFLLQYRVSKMDKATVMLSDGGATHAATSRFMRMLYFGLN